MLVDLVLGVEERCRTPPPLKPPVVADFVVTRVSSLMRRWSRKERSACGRFLRGSPSPGRHRVRRWSKETPIPNPSNHVGQYVLAIGYGYETENRRRRHGGLIGALEAERTRVVPHGHAPGRVIGVSEDPANEVHLAVKLGYELQLVGLFRVVVGHTEDHVLEGNPGIGGQQRIGCATDPVHEVVVSGHLLEVVGTAVVVAQRERIRELVVGAHRPLVALAARYAGAVDVQPVGDVAALEAGCPRRTTVGNGRQGFPVEIPGIVFAFGFFVEGERIHYALRCAVPLR